MFYTHSYASVDVKCNYELVMRVCTVSDHLNRNASDNEPFPVTQARLIYKSCMDTGELKFEHRQILLRICSLLLPHVSIVSTENSDHLNPFKTKINPHCTVFTNPPPIQLFIALSDEVHVYMLRSAGGDVQGKHSNR